MSCDCEIEVRNAAEERVLRILFGVNAAMFIVELVVGLVADSSGVLADSLDMLADALVYGVGLYAVGRASITKILAARLSGIFQLLLAVIMMFDILRRGLVGSEPVSLLMITVSGVALAANVVCLRLITKHRDGGVHMRASWIFSRNDVLANLGVIAAACLVAATDSRWPDLVIGSLISLIVVGGGISILRDAAKESITAQN